VPYTPDWELLADALRRVQAAGVAEDDAKIDLCRAIGDGKIHIRALMAKTAPDVGGKTLLHGNVDVPPRLNPADFDWVKSRPLARWNTGSGNFRLGSAEKGSPTERDPLGPPQTALGRSQPERERARLVIDELFPKGVPDQAVLPNGDLIKQVGKRLKERG
jgi:hypothetical protein